jgi:hypothetical protein
MNFEEGCSSNDILSMKKIAANKIMIYTHTVEETSNLV